MKWAILPLVSSCSTSLHCGRYAFPVPQRVGGWVGLGGWLHTKIVCTLDDGHSSQYQPTNSTVTRNGTHESGCTTTVVLRITARTIRPQKSNLVDNHIHDETVCTHYNNNASTADVKITMLMKITTMSMACIQGSTINALSSVNYRAARRWRLQWER